MPKRNKTILVIGAVLFIIGIGIILLKSGNGNQTILGISCAIGSGLIAGGIVILIAKMTKHG